MQLKNVWKEVVWRAEQVIPETFGRCRMVGYRINIVAGSYAEVGKAKMPALFIDPWHRISVTYLLEMDKAINN